MGRCGSDRIAARRRRVVAAQQPRRHGAAGHRALRQPDDRRARLGRLGGAAQHRRPRRDSRANGAQPRGLSLPACAEGARDRRGG